MTVIAGAAALSAVVAAIGFGDLFALQSNALAQDQKIQIGSMSHDGTEDDPEAYVAERGRSAIVLSSEIMQVSAKRGERVEIPVAVKHLGGDHPYPQLGVTALPSSAIFYPPSISESITDEERLDILNKGRIPEGAIPMSILFHMTPDTITLLAGETQTVKLVVTLPSTLPEEMVGTSFFVSPELAITGKDPDARDAGVFTLGIEVNVI